MNVAALLRENKDQIAKNWLEAIFQTYPLDTVGFMRRQHDEFANPVGARTTQAVDELVAMLVEDSFEAQATEAALDVLVRVRAVQSFTPARAVGVVFLLKSVVRALVEKSKTDSLDLAELLQFESKVDSLALISFDIYMKCHKQIFEMRVEELRRGHHMLLKRAGMICEGLAEEPDTPTK